MKTFLYLSLLPEALIASSLPPDEFGSYLATGANKRARGPAIFFKLSGPFATAQLRAAAIGEVLNSRGEQLHHASSYLSIHRALELTPVEAMETLHLATDDGRVLSLEPAEYSPLTQPIFHLYQEFAPVVPRVVTKLEPKKFAEWITSPGHPLALPAIVFAGLRLDGLATGPDASGAEQLPYSNIEHLKDCLREVAERPDKKAKMVARFLQQDLLYRNVSGGFFAASADGSFRYFPMPTRDELESLHFPWWRSALTSSGI